MTAADNTIPIPESVLEVLEAVRMTGAFNMLDRTSVTGLVKRAGPHEAWAWLKTNERRYMEALRAMGARRVPQ